MTGCSETHRPQRGGQATAICQSRLRATPKDHPLITVRWDKLIRKHTTLSPMLGGGEKTVAIPCGTNKQATQTNVLRLKSPAALPTVQATLDPIVQLGLHLPAGPGTRSTNIDSTQLRDMKPRAQTERLNPDLLHLSWQTFSARSVGTNDWTKDEAPHAHLFGQLRGSRTN